MNFFTNTKGLYRLFFKIFGAMLAASLFIYSIFLYSSYLSIMHETDEVLDTVLDQKSKHINAMLHHVEVDLDFVVAYVENKIKENNPELKKKLETTFAIFAKNHHHYQQIRYLDLEGKEFVRVDRIDNKVVIKKGLQDKSSRYYYQDATKLKEGEIYLSPLDLNVEYGKVEVPYKPMLRFVQPIFVNGVKKGYIVINYCARMLLESIRKSDKHINHLLLNKSGYYLIGPERNREFGFMFNRSQDTFVNDYSKLWDTILEGKNRVLEFDNKYAHYKTYDPISVISPNRSIKSTKVWHMIGYYSYDKVYQELFDLFKMNLIFLIPLVVIEAFITFLLTRLKIKDMKAQEAILKHQEKIENLLDEQQELQEKLQKVIDTQNSIVILTDSKELKFVNQTFLDFFGYDSLADFRKYYNCICDRFIEQDNFFHLGKVKEDEENWIESLLNLSGRQRVVSMLDSNVEPHAFTVSINTFGEHEYIVNFLDISDNMIEKLELKKEATIDQLTKLYNRVYFSKNIKNILEMQNKHHMKTGIIFFDIDHFKNVNDTYGHDAGDVVLQKVASIVKKHTRSEDKVIRWGGEEFIIITEVDNIESLAQIAEHLRIEIQEHQFKDIGSITCSFGCHIHDYETNILDTVKQADDKLYRAKESGRNKVVF